MALKQIQLPPSVIKQLYKNCLVNIPDKKNNQQKSGIRYLGKNQKGILIFVNEKDFPFLKDEEFNFLTNILTACQLTIDDIALVNRSFIPDINLDEIVNELPSSTFLFFGLTAQDFKLPVNFPLYQVQSHGQRKYLSTDSVSVIKSNKELKTKLWQCLQRIFNFTPKK